MKNLILLITLFISCHSIATESIYSAAYGDPKNEPLVFLHGGPGHHSIAFEKSTAEKLAQAGFYVIVYDRRGEGRSIDTKSQYSFEETNADLALIYNKYKIEQAHLIGHSFGGVIGSLFAKSHPEKVKSIVLVGAPIALQETFLTIIKTCKTIYKNNNDTESLAYINLLEKMDSKSLQYSSYCFGHAMQNGLYTTSPLTEEARVIYKQLKADSLVNTYTSQINYNAPQGFWNNEKYTTIDLSKTLNKLIKNEVSIFGLYGKEDGLYSEDQIRAIKDKIGNENLRYLSNCSHNVFIDQQQTFISSLINWLK